MPDNPVNLDINQILNILPHRYPFLLVDRVVEMDLEKGYVLAQKNVTINESFFQGHFPQAPIMPGVLILEALAQAGGILVHLKGPANKIAILLSVNQAKFRHPVKPGDVLFLRGQGLHFSSKGGKIKAEALVNDKVVAEAEIGFVFADKSQI
ncbi:MAG: 3-hydroxyacyl-ACP dehydratase FabZ [Candidatus Protochlamydia sp.]|nr:3-hydroxyacyl-ACP dehydratase FabZ [Candidatus Protochlamydia sp.]